MHSGTEIVGLDSEQQKHQMFAKIVHELVLTERRYSKTNSLSSQSGQIIAMVGDQWLNL